MNTPPADYLTTRELAEMLRIKERKVYDLVASNRVPCTRATGKLLFSRSAIEAWLDQMRQVRNELKALSFDQTSFWAVMTLCWSGH
tara:strand:- start:215 stop:472 length:258 start_codon:yes stop_codon:yes gene_type:complete